MTSDDVPLKDFLLAVINEREDKYEQRFQALAQASDTALKNATTAVLKAETATDRRLEGLNELRGALTDQQASLARRDEVHLLVSGLKAELSARMDGLEKTLASATAQIERNAGRSSGISATVALLIGLIPVALAVAAYFASKASGP